MIRNFTTLDILEASHYAENIIRRAKCSSLSINDVVNEGFENGVFVYGKMREYVLIEKRRDKISLPREYICTKCNKIKSGIEFYYRTDYRNNHTYFIQPCKECHIIAYKSKKNLL